MSQFEGMMGGTPGEGFGGPPENVHLGPTNQYGYGGAMYGGVGQPSNVHQGNANASQPPTNVYQGTGGGQPAYSYAGNVYQGTAPPPVATGPSPYNLQSVTDGMASMLPPSGSYTPTMQPQIGTGSITQYATPPPQQQQQQQQIQTQSQANSYASQPATTGSYAARSAMAHGSTAGSVAGSTEART
jgi:hypothetical protein